MAKYNYTVKYEGKKSQAAASSGGGVIRAIISIGVAGVFGYIIWRNWGAISSATNNLVGYAENSLSNIPVSTTTAAASIIPTSSYTNTNTNTSTNSGTTTNTSGYTGSGFFNFAKTQGWYPYVAQYSTQYNVPQSIILGIIRQESDGNSNLISSTGAVGLMQVEPSTAGLSQNTLLDPVNNIEAGTSYLASLYSQLGNWTDALDAYFAGTGNINNTYQITPHPQTADMPSGTTYAQQIEIRATAFNTLLASNSNQGTLLSYLTNLGAQNG
ncbi:MAG: lytic transglycosylase domain-containing protein [Acidiferrobacteraceae bacterium]